MTSSIGSLEDVVAADTVLSHVDGERGILWIRGRTPQQLIAEHGYEGAVALLWEGFAGTGLSGDAMRARLGAGREAAFARLPSWLAAVKERPPIEATRICLAAVPDDVPPAEIVASLPVGIAALLRAQQGKPPVAPDPALGVAADFLRMLHGAPVPPSHAAGLEAYLVTLIDNGLSASSFAARVIASTQATLTAAVAGAYCALTGPLHGGAPGPVLDMLDEIGKSGDIDGWLERRILAGERLMGFGHRVWKVRDPRADALGAALQRMGPDAGRIAFAQEVERRAIALLGRHKPGRRLEVNVEFNTALLLDAVGLPRATFTPVFAMARSAGWLAHAMEQQQTGRLVRPAANYIGPRPAAA